MLFQLQRLYSTEQDKMIAQIVLDTDLKWGNCSLCGGCYMAFMWRV